MRALFQTAEFAEKKADEALDLCKKMGLGEDSTITEAVHKLHDGAVSVEQKLGNKHEKQPTPAAQPAAEAAEKPADKPAKKEE
jgi:hypothetical protein